MTEEPTTEPVDPANLCEAMRTEIRNLRPLLEATVAILETITYPDRERREQLAVGVEAARVVLSGPSYADVPARDDGPPRPRLVPDLREPPPEAIVSVARLVLRTLCLVAVGVPARGADSVPLILARMDANTRRWFDEALGRLLTGPHDRIAREGGDRS